MEAKKFWFSKIFWLNIIVLVAMIVQALTGLLVPVDIQIVALAAVNLTLRYFTGKPLEWSKTPRDKFYWPGENSKKIWLSKTFWLNILTVLFVMLQGFTGWLCPPAIQLGILATINVILRLATKQKINWANPKRAGMVSLLLCIFLCLTSCAALKNSRVSFSANVAGACDISLIWDFDPVKEGVCSVADQLCIEAEIAKNLQLGSKCDPHKLLELYNQAREKKRKQEIEKAENQKTEKPEKQESKNG